MRQRQILITKALHLYLTTSNMICYFLYNNFFIDLRTRVNKKFKYIILLIMINLFGLNV